jgi:hypothetical protein
MSRTARRWAARLAILVTGLVAGGLPLVGPAAILPSAAAATCTSAGGVSVVVDFRELGGSTITACAADGGGKSADQIVAAVGVSITYATRQPGFVCRVQGEPAADPCVNTSPASAYWGLWWADGSKATWTYSSYGIGGLTVPAGGSVGLSWQQDRENSGAVPPGVAPPVVAAAPSSTPSPTSSPSSSPTSSSPASSPNSPTATPSNGGGSQSSSPSPGAGGGSGGTGGSTPTGSPATPSGSPASPSQSPLASESPGDSRASGGSGDGSGKGSDDPALDDESPGDSPASEDAEGSGSDVESPSDSGASADPTAGQPSTDEPGRIPAALTWSILGLLAIAIAGSAVVARRRRGSDAP